MKALHFSTFGGPGVLQYSELPDARPQAGELLVQLKAIGLNYADVYRRQGNYHLTGTPPYINGYEGAGIVVDANGVEGFTTGDRMAFADVPRANAELVAVPHTHALPLPAFISFETAAAVLLQGLTAQYLTADSYTVQATDSVLVHAAAGGVGQLLLQLCRQKGATVLGLTSSEQKMDAAKTAGAHHVFLYREDWVAAVKNRYPAGADVVYESVGSTLLQSLDATRAGGTVVFFGFAGGNPPAVDPRLLMDGSKTLTGGDLWTYLHSKEERLRRSAQLFEWIETGYLQVPPPTLFALKDGAAAHALLESRRSTGKIVLIP